uniref:NADH dehydrogenase subunit 4L n=1 Tax=Romanomermis culicivorax TaxID=13658 RepID=A0A915J824_ROMCU
MLLYKSLKSMAAMMVSVECRPRLLMIVAAVVVFLVVAVIVIAMEVVGIVMAIETNGMRVARIVTVVGGIAAAGRQSEGLQW